MYLNYSNSKFKPCLMLTATVALSNSYVNVNLTFNHFTH